MSDDLKEFLSRTDIELWINQPRGSTPYAFRVRDRIYWGRTPLDAIEKAMAESAVQAEKGG